MESHQDSQLTGKIIFFKGAYDTLDLFVDELNREFMDMGYQTMIYDVNQTQASLGKLAQFVQTKVHAVITFNNLGFNMELKEGHNVWEELDIPCINILMDHPFHYLNALQKAPCNAIVLCTDRNHVKYIERFIPNIKKLGYLPHAGREGCGVNKPIAERSIDVMYAGGLSKHLVSNLLPNAKDFCGFDLNDLCDKCFIRKPVYRTFTIHR